MTREEQSKKIQQIIAKAWADDEFKQKLLADTTATLKAEGVEVPPGIEVRAVENSETITYLVLPMEPNKSELSMDDLDKVAGGYVRGLALD